MKPQRTHLLIYDTKRANTSHLFPQSNTWKEKSLHSQNTTHNNQYPCKENNNLVIKLYRKLDINYMYHIQTRAILHFPHLYRNLHETLYLLVGLIAAAAKAQTLEEKLINEAHTLPGVTLVSHLFLTHPHISAQCRQGWLGKCISATDIQL